MKRLVTYLLCSITCFTSLYADLTLEFCIEQARTNYPLIRKFDILSATKDVSLSDINKSWLPRISLYGQGNWQNDVPQLPDALSGIFNQLGQSVKGLDKLQYKVGVDLSQTIWDGGQSRIQRQRERTQYDVDAASLEVELYDVEERVLNLFFGILLYDEQIAQTRLTIDLLNANVERISNMLAAGTAMQCDVDMLTAQKLSLCQQLTQAEAYADLYRQLLSIYIGEDISNEKLTLPDDSMPTDMTSDHPELRLFDARVRLNESKLNEFNTSLMPKVGFFASSYYGYPGYNYFESMLNRDLSFNITIGVKVSWNIDSYYSRHNNKLRIELADESVRTDRDTFLFNSNLQSQSSLRQIRALRDIVATDSEIVNLRVSVREAAEAQMSNGVIDATAFLTKLTDENDARLTAGYHNIQLIQMIYQLKHILNR